jgi:hypothetical protein
MGAPTIAQSIGLFLLAGLCEIGGGWLVWQWLREGWGLTWGLVGGLILDTLWNHSYLSGNPLWSRLRGLRRVLHCFITFVGLALGPKSA